MNSFWHKAAAAAAQNDFVVAADFAAQQNRARSSIRRDPPPLPPALVPTDDQLRLRLAEELEYARRLLELLGDELSTSPVLVVRHPRALQSIDIIGQTLGHVADVIRSSDPEGAAERIGMVELRARLLRRSIG